MHPNEIILTDQNISELTQSALNLDPFHPYKEINTHPYLDALHEQSNRQKNETPHSPMPTPR